MLSSGSSGRPLEGVRILDLTRLLPGPYLSLVLADLGADVIKIEPPNGGDWVRYVPPMHGESSVAFAGLNRGKRSLTLDLKKPGGVDVLKRLVASADVLVEQFRPGVMDRLGVGWEVLKQVNPRLVYVAITGFGQTGPYRLRAGHDLNYLALSGALAMTGPPGGAPQVPGVQIADVGGGGLYGAIGVLAALAGRERTGEGRFVDVSMTEGALAFNALTLPVALADGPVETRGTDQLGGAHACYGVYETADGKYITLAALEPKFWAVFCQAAAKPEWLKKHRGHDEQMREEIGAFFREKTRDEWAAHFGEVDACVEAVLELDELDSHPQHMARGVFFDLEGSGLRQYRTPLMSPEDGPTAGPPPGLGAHTAEILADAGFSLEEIEALKSQRVVTQPRPR